LKRDLSGGYTLKLSGGEFFSCKHICLHNRGVPELEGKTDPKRPIFQNMGLFFSKIQTPCKQICLHHDPKTAKNDPKWAFSISSDSCVSRCAYTTKNRGADINRLYNPLGHYSQKQRVHIITSLCKQICLQRTKTDAKAPPPPPPPPPDVSFY